MELRQAIHEAAVIRGLVDEDDILMSFVVVSAWTKIEGDDGQSTYIHQLEDGMKLHEAVGLLHMGLDSVFSDSSDE